MLASEGFPWLAVTLSIYFFDTLWLNIALFASLSKSISYSNSLSPPSVRLLYSLQFTLPSLTSSSFTENAVPFTLSVKSAIPDSVSTLPFTLSFPPFFTYISASSSGSLILITGLAPLVANLNPYAYPFAATLFPLSSFPSKPSTYVFSNTKPALLLNTLKNL